MSGGGPSWTAAEAAAATGGEARGASSRAATGVSIDTRSLEPGDLFVALTGDNRDGHGFVADALRRGAAVALVSRVPDGIAEDAPLLLVPDTLKGLEALGRAGRARSAARVAGVTGSVGKTGTKEALRHVLAGQGPTHASAASHNNHWGVPLSLARLPRDAAYGIFELGMNHAGEIAALTRQVRPDVALVTLIAPAHLGAFDSLEAIADAKAEIFAGLEPGGVAVLNRDDPFFDRLRGHAGRHAHRIVTFGAHAAAGWRLAEAGLDPEGSDVVATRPGGGSLAYRLGVPGRHWVHNSLAVLAVADALDADPEAAAGALATFQPPAGRGRKRMIPLEGGGEALLLDESYNANPASMRAALALLGQMPGRRVAVLGDMLELGERGPELHAGLARDALAAGVARVFACGPLMAGLFDALPGEVRGLHARESAALAGPVRAALRPGDVVLVKGSLGSRMGPVVEALTAATAAARD